MAKVTITDYGVQAGTERTCYCKWTWTKSNTDYYRVYWYYYPGSNQGAFLGGYTDVDATTGGKQCTYDAPDTAYQVKFKVKPVAKKHKVNGVNTSYWTAEYTALKTIALNTIPLTPPTPDVSIDSYTLTASLTNLDVQAKKIRFQVLKYANGTYTSYKTIDSTISYNAASCSCTVKAGYSYAVRARSFTGSTYSGWSDYSSLAGTIPNKVTTFEYCKALSSTSVRVKWVEPTGATSYNIQYTENYSYFYSNPSAVSSSTSTLDHAEITGLTTGQAWYFKVQAVNDYGESAWSSTVSTVLGTTPEAPTTWQTSSTAVVGGSEVTLYWTHNTEDGSSQTAATIDINGKTTVLSGTTSTYTIDPSNYSDGDEVLWRVKTAGITEKYGAYSAYRSVLIYEPPTLGLSITDSSDVPEENMVQAFPITITGDAGPESQTPIGYSVSIVADESYTTVDEIGNERTVSAGEEIYQAYIDSSEDLSLVLSAGDVNLENNVQYTVNAILSTTAGLTAEGSYTFFVAWTDDVMEPDAEIGIDSDSLTAMIHPYCYDAVDEDSEETEGTLSENVVLSVYRREFDGSFTLIESNVANTDNTFVTDPHPALDYARYRIVATSTTTGMINYYDVPGVPVGEKAVVLQWDETWTDFDTDEEEPFADPTWSGSMLKLPYNIDVSDSHSVDVELVEYIGRERPVSYYGTQLSTSSTWSMEILKSDTDTLYALRRLSKYLGDVYVREPSGSGYWASLSVSFSQSHNSLTVPVTLNITRVEGDV